MEIQAAILLVIVFFLMLAFSVPVSYSIIVSALVTIVAFLTPGFGVFVSAQKMVSGIDSFSLIAVPFFILAGLLMNSGGIAKRLINLALLVLGKVPGSLALTNIAGNAMFGSISGSGIAAATAIGGVMLPLEKEQKYDEGFAAAVIGGYGNMYGAILGGLIIGFCETFTAAYITSSYKDFIVFFLLILVMIFMPRGIFKAKVYDR